MMSCLNERFRLMVKIIQILLFLISTELHHFLSSFYSLQPLPTVLHVIPPIGPTRKFIVFYHICHTHTYTHMCLYTTWWVCVSSGLTTLYWKTNKGTSFLSREVNSSSNTQNLPGVIPQPLKSRLTI